MQKQAIKTSELTVQQSLTLVRNLLRTSISTICFFRGLLPDDCFNMVKLSGLTIRQLLPENNDSKLILNWLEEGVFPSIAKNYIEQVIFAIYAPLKETENYNTLLETYCFHVVYNNGQVSLELSNKNKTLDHEKLKSDIRASTISLIRTLITCNNVMKPIPEDRIISMRLIYKNEVPENYQPKFFKDAKDEPFRFNEKPTKIRIGNVDTPFHEVKIKVIANSSQFIDANLDLDYEGSQSMIPLKNDVEDNSNYPPKKAISNVITKVNDQMETEDDHDHELTQEVVERSPSPDLSKPITSKGNKVNSKLEVSKSNKIDKMPTQSQLPILNRAVSDNLTTELNKYIDKAVIFTTRDINIAFKSKDIQNNQEKLKNILSAGVNTGELIELATGRYKNSKRAKDIERLQPKVLEFMEQTRSKSMRPFDLLDKFGNENKLSIQYLIDTLVDDGKIYKDFNRYKLTNKEHKKEVESSTKNSPTRPTRSNPQDQLQVSQILQEIPAASQRALKEIRKLEIAMVPSAYDFSKDSQMTQRPEEKLKRKSSVIEEGIIQGNNKKSKLNINYI